MLYAISLAVFEFGCRSGDVYISKRGLASIPDGTLRQCDLQELAHRDEGAAAIGQQLAWQMWDVLFSGIC